MATSKSHLKEDQVAALGLPPADTMYINEKLEELTAQIHKVQDKRKNSAHNLHNVHKMQQKMSKDPTIKYVKTKLKALYNTALNDAKAEAEAIRTALEQIQEIRATLKTRPRKQGLYSKETALRKGALLKMVRTRFKRD